MHYNRFILLPLCMSAALLGLSAGESVNNIDGECYDADVIIIGAGVAGITFARELEKNGIKNFLILEGRNESGGRFQDVKIGNITIELGPNWVHGTRNNPIFELVNEYGISGRFEDPESVICRDVKGHDVTKSFLAEREKLKNVMKTMGEDYQFTSLRNALKLNGWKNRTAIENVAEYYLIDYMDAAPPEVLSGSFREAKETRIDSLYGPQFFITEQSGYKVLVKRLEEEALGVNAERLKLDHFVERIKWNEKGVRVETSKGIAYTGKVLLATPSIGVYQNMPELFAPRLPRWKESVFNRFKMATYTKIFMRFPHRFWDNFEYIFYASGTRHLFPVWQSLDAFNRFGIDTNILMVTVTWSESHRVEKMSEGDLTMEVMHHLRLVYGSSIPNPTDIVVPKWKENKFFRGSYSLYHANVTHLDFVALRANVGPLFFAGEATHEIYQGYIHGAFYEGKNRAYDVIQALRGYWNLADFKMNDDFYDSCLRDLSDCCYV